MAFLLYRICFFFTLICQGTLALLVGVIPLEVFRWHAAHPLMGLLSWWPSVAVLFGAFAACALLTVLLRACCLRRLR
ncbi:MAG TPA: hypothetical protein VKX46_09545 [Ktedonobacteraceae bacterium]|nr:hypothetical protein [Ktedonobacteraceae bacterium]